MYALYMYAYIYIYTLQVQVRHLQGSKTNSFMTRLHNAANPASSTHNPPLSRSKQSNNPSGVSQRPSERADVWLFLGEGQRGSQPVGYQEHLSCFAPAMLALGSISADSSSSIAPGGGGGARKSGGKSGGGTRYAEQDLSARQQSDLLLAKTLCRTCGMLYKQVISHNNY